MLFPGARPHQNGVKNSHFIRLLVALEKHLPAGAIAYILSTYAWTVNPKSESARPGSIPARQRQSLRVHEEPRCDGPEDEAPDVRGVRHTAGRLLHELRS
jgi:hypothetical protein